MKKTIKPTKTESKKLTLRLQTVRQLEPQELEAAVGGIKNFCNQVVTT